MKFLCCILCMGELDVIDSTPQDIVKNTKCRDCGAQLMPEDNPEPMITYVKRNKE